MFKRKRKQKQKRTLTIRNEHATLYEGPVQELPIVDERIIAGSIEFYDDPEPCMIHRSAVISRYYMQIETWLDQIEYKNSQPIDIDEIPEEIKALLDMPVGTNNA